LNVKHFQRTAKREQHESKTKSERQTQSDRPTLLDRFFVFRKKVDQPEPVEEMTTASC
jgi:hypothetical protein